MHMTHEMEDDTRFDRLVDGELTPEEYRELLASLDDEPGGWRQCAMAFLEAQALGTELRSVRCESEAAPKVAVARRSSWWTRQAVPLTIACAASFLLAFWVGDGFRDFVGGGQPGPRLVHDSNTDDLPLQAPIAANTDDPQPVAHARFVVDGQEIDVPVFDADDQYGQRLLQRPMQVPDNIRRRLEQAGFEVRQRRELTPVPLEDGRQVIFPVDQLEITPVSSMKFQ